jgi:hypothetical protein
MAKNKKKNLNKNNKARQQAKRQANQAEQKSEAIENKLMKAENIKQLERLR